MDYTKFVIENFRDEIVKHYQSHEEEFSLQGYLFASRNDAINTSEFDMIHKMFDRIEVCIDYNFIHFVFTGKRIPYDYLEDTYGKEKYWEITWFLNAYRNIIYREERFFTPDCLSEYTLKYFANLLDSQSPYSGKVFQMIKAQFTGIAWHTFWNSSKGVYEMAV